MPIAQNVLLSLDELRSLIEPIIREGFAGFGVRNLVLEEDEDFEGDPFVWATVNVDERTDTRTQIEVNDDVQQAVWKTGDRRYVFLTALPPPDADEAEEDGEEP
ncbi:MAG: hypothetical protein IT534_12940 [Bauldia sp.]|nr:hypothetical protein [Bauldia sp.]